MSHSIGVSAGSYVAASLAAVEPAVRATVMNGALASMAMLRLSPTFRGGQNGVAFWVQNRTPSILNSDHGVTSVDGITVPTNGPAFNENIPLRAPATAIGFPPSSPVVNTVPGAMALEELFERMEWSMEASSPQAFAPHLRKAPLAGVPPRPLLLQFARGDVTDVNPNQAAIVRAGDLLDRAVMYRHDRFVCAYPGVRPAGNPHSFLMSVPCGKPPDARQCAFGSELPVSDAVTEIARFAQRQAAHFFETDGAEILTPLSDPDAPPQVAQRLDEVFDVPVRGPVPEDLGFVLPGATCQPR